MAVTNEEEANKEMMQTLGFVIIITLAFILIAVFSKKEAERRIVLDTDEWTCEEFKDQECVMLRKLPPIN